MHGQGGNASGDDTGPFAVSGGRGGNVSGTDPTRDDTSPVVPLHDRQLELLRRLDDPVFGTITRAVHPVADMAVREIRAHRKRAEDWWRSLADEERTALIALCCRGCGALDPSCQCENDE